MALPSMELVVDLVLIACPTSVSQLVNVKTTVTEMEVVRMDIVNVIQGFRECLVNRSVHTIASVVVNVLTMELTLAPVFVGFILNHIVSMMVNRIQHHYRRMLEKL